MRFMIALGIRLAASMTARSTRRLAQAKTEASDIPPSPRRAKGHWGGPRITSMGAGCEATSCGALWATAAMAMRGQQTPVGEAMALVIGTSIAHVAMPITLRSLSKPAQGAITALKSKARGVRDSLNADVASAGVRAAGAWSAEVAMWAAAATAWRGDSPPVSEAALAVTMGTRLARVAIAAVYVIPWVASMRDQHK